MFSSIFKEEDSFCDFLFPFLYIKHWKGVYSERKEFAPRGSKFFPFRVDLFSEDGKMFKQLPRSLLKVCHIPITASTA